VAMSLFNFLWAERGGSVGRTEGRGRDLPMYGFARNLSSAICSIFEGEGKKKGKRGKSTERLMDVCFNA